MLLDRVAVLLQENVVEARPELLSIGKRRWGIGVGEEGRQKELEKYLEGEKEERGEGGRTCKIC